METGAYVDQFDDGLRGPSSREAPMFALQRCAVLEGAASSAVNPASRPSLARSTLKRTTSAPLGEGGLDVLTNVVALCATDHRRAHFASVRSALGEELRQIAEGG